MKILVTTILLALVTHVHAEPRVVGDEACPRYAVDIEAFASCDGDRVAAFDRPTTAAALLPESAVPVAKRTRSGLYVDAAGAHRLKHDNPRAIVLIDVRSRLEVGFTGQPASTDLHVPLLDTSWPLRWDDELGGWAMVRNARFAHEVGERLAALGIGRDTPLLLLCRSGESSAHAADQLAAAGYAQTISIVDGFEGDIGPDGRRSVNGWKNAGLPWTARPLATLIYGARTSVDLPH
jgi:rhodanese-related sulfurtransferase